MPYWDVEIPLIVRNLIGDVTVPYTYSDARINQLAVVAANYVQSDANLTTTYDVDIVNVTMSPDPSAPGSRDTVFIGLVSLKTACMLDQSTYRTKAALEGIRTSLGSASLSVGGNLAGYKYLLTDGSSPCSVYQTTLNNWNIGNATAVSAVLSPFVGNNFDPASLPYWNGGGFDRNLYQ